MRSLTHLGIVVWKDLIALHLCIYRVLSVFALFIMGDSHFVTTLLVSEALREAFGEAFGCEVQHSLYSI